MVFLSFLNCYTVCLPHVSLYFLKKMWQTCIYSVSNTFLILSHVLCCQCEDDQKLKGFDLLRNVLGTTQFLSLPNAKPVLINFQCRRGSQGQTQPALLVSWIVLAGG